MANIPWYRSPWGAEIVTTCQKIISGELQCIEGSRRMAKLSEIVLDSAHGDKWLHEDWKIFFSVLGSEDQERDVENTFAGSVRSAASKLLKEAESST